MAASEWYHQELAIVGTIDPTSSTTAGTLWTDAIDCDVFEKVIFIVQTNTVQANTTLTLTVYSDDASATGGMTNAVATSTALTNANDDSQIWVEVDTEDFNVDGRHRYCRGALVIGASCLWNAQPLAWSSVMAHAMPRRCYIQHWAGFWV